MSTVTRLGVDTQSGIPVSVETAYPSDAGEDQISSSRYGESISDSGIERHIVNIQNMHIELMHIMHIVNMQLVVSCKVCIL